MDPFIGQVIMFGGNFAPRGWAFCDGQLLAISSHSALFSILGTTYGGDGRTTFALPDLRGRVAIQQGTGPGLSNHRLGARGGNYNTTLTTQNLPSHNHGITMPISTTVETEAQGYLSNGNIYAEEATANSNYPGTVTGFTGNNQSFSNEQPFVAVYYIIALVGTYPSRN